MKPKIRETILRGGECWDVEERLEERGNQVLVRIERWRGSRRLNWTDWVPAEAIYQIQD
jgi:hypothetical protein